MVFAMILCAAVAGVIFGMAEERGEVITQIASAIIMIVLLIGATGI